MVKEIGNHSMTVLYPNLSYNEVCCKGTNFAIFAGNRDGTAVIHLQFWAMGPGTRCFQYQ